MIDMSESLTVTLLLWSTWVNPSQSLFCSERPERFAQGRSFVMIDLSESLTVALLFRVTWAICSWSLFKKKLLSKERQERFGKKGGKTVKNVWKNDFFVLFFQANHWFFRAMRSIRSFVKCDLSNSLTDALLSWASWANISRSLFNLSNFEQKSKEQRAIERKSEFPTLKFGELRTKQMAIWGV